MVEPVLLGLVQYLLLLQGDLVPLEVEEEERVCWVLAECMEQPHSSLVVLLAVGEQEEECVCWVLAECLEQRHSSLVVLEAVEKEEEDLRNCRLWRIDLVCGT
jgi:hypothetical protein